MMHTVRVGTSLILGLATRAGAVLGALLLMLCYLAYPPLIESDGMALGCFPVKTTSGIWPEPESGRTEQNRSRSAEYQ